jgi:UbiD family decarboxylase
MYNIFGAKWDTKVYRPALPIWKRTVTLSVLRKKVDPYLQMAAIHLRVFEHEGPAILFENVKGSKFPAVSNLFGTLDRSRFILGIRWRK